MSRPASSRRVDLVVVGAGGHGRELADLIDAATMDGAPHRLLGFLDDDPRRHGTLVADRPVLGGHAWLLAPARGSVRYVLGVGAPAAKFRLAAVLDGARRRAPAVIHPRATVGARVVLGPGAVVGAHALVTCDASLGAHAHLNVHASVSHDCAVGAYAHLAPGSRLAGSVRLGEGCDLGMGALVLPGVEIGAWSVIGAGAVVTASLPPDCTAVGVPARVTKTRAAGWQRP